MKRRLHPVVISAKRFDAIMGRSQMAHKRDKLAADEEERRYMDYLKEGSDHLCSLFSNMGHISLDEEKQAKLDQEVLEDEIRRKQVKKEDEQLRKQRIMRANRILENMKSGQRSLHHALVDSEMMYQRKFNEDLNREIEADGKRQERLDEAQCPLKMIPFCGVTEEQEKAVQERKGQEMKEYYAKELEVRRQRRLEEKEQKDTEVIIDRAQYKCLQEAEQKAAKEKVKVKREFCQRALQEARKEKAQREKMEKICDFIDDRVICVDLAKKRKLDLRSGKELKEIRAKLLDDREKLATQHCRMLQAKQRQENAHQEEIVKRHNAKVLAEADRRSERIKELREERRAYQQKEQEEAKQKQERDEQIQRFHVAQRFKNAETNRRFEVTQKRRKDKATKNLRKILYGQRDEFLKRRDEELLRISACDDDPYLREDVSFFDDAVKLVAYAKQSGRSVYPMAKAVQVYRQQNKIDLEPEGRMVHRSRLRDYCWPGFHSKADLAYQKYDQREQCRQQEEKNRRGIFAKCIKITKMAAEEQPYKKCDMECPNKLFLYQGIPAMDNVNSVACGSKRRPCKSWC